MKTNNLQVKAAVSDIIFSINLFFGNKCEAIYVMGSLAKGGFSEIASDIDIGIIFKGELEGIQSKIDTIRLKVIKDNPLVKNNISIFWGSIESINGHIVGGRYPPFDRLDLVEHALLLSGNDIRNKLLKPSRKELEIAGALFALEYLGNKERIEEFHHCGHIIAKGTVYTTKTILFPARFIYLANTGEIASNDTSYEYYIDNFTGPDAYLVEQGYKWRFNSLPKDLEQVKLNLQEGLVPLYSKFIDLYINRMVGYGKNEISKNLGYWKKSIV